MKKFIYIAVLLISSYAIAQTGSVDYDQITGNDLNDTSMKVQRFMAKRMRYSPKGERTFDHQSTDKVVVKTTYQNFTRPDETLVLTYTTHPEAHNLIVDDLTVQGDKEAVIRFFVMYWNTELEITDNQTSIAQREMLGDQISLYTSANPRIEVHTR